MLTTVGCAARWACRRGDHPCAVVAAAAEPDGAEAVLHAASPSDGAEAVPHAASPSDEAPGEAAQQDAASDGMVPRRGAPVVPELAGAFAQSDAARRAALMALSASPAAPWIVAVPRAAVAPHEAARWGAPAEWAAARGLGAAQPPGVARLSATRTIFARSCVKAQRAALAAQIGRAS